MRAPSPATAHGLPRLKTIHRIVFCASRTGSEALRPVKPDIAIGGRRMGPGKQCPYSSHLIVSFCLGSYRNHPQEHAFCVLPAVSDRHHILLA